MDITLLKVMRQRDMYQQIGPAISQSALDDRTLFLLREYRLFFKQFPDVDEITQETWHTFFETFRHKELSREERATYRAIMGQAFEPIEDCIKDGVLRRVYELNLATKMANVADDYNSGKEIDIQALIQESFDEFKINIGASNTADSWIQDDIGELLAEEEREDGIRFRLNCLNHCMRPLRPGDFGIIAGRPDRGKTTFLASESTYWASQVPDDRPIIWLNNEGPGRRIIPRLYQASLGIDMPELIRQHRQGKLVSAYETAIGGSVDRIRVIDIHGFNVGQVQTIIENHKPYIIIVDMIDHIKANTGEARTDRILEELYKWFREQAVLQDCIVVATSQISADGDGLLFPQQHMLKDSKTGKQGACDFMIMMGASNDEMMQHIRGIGLEKNKLARAGRPNNPRAEVEFSPAIARLTDGGYDCD